MSRTAGLMKGGLINALATTRREAASGVDPAVAILARLLRERAGTLEAVHADAGLPRRTTQRWTAGTTSPRLADVRAVLNALGYDLQVVRRET